MKKLDKHVFDHSNPYTIGVEEEYMLCSPVDGELIPMADSIINALPDNLMQRFSYELILSEIEVNTPICNTVKEAVDCLLELRNYTRELGNKLNFNIGISGTHPTANPDDQIFVQNDNYSWVKNQMKYYARQNITFALHVHIAVTDAETSIHVLNGLRRWIPPLLAISANSPFFNQKQTGMRSTRTIQFGAFPRTQIPQFFKNYTDYENLTSKYLKMKTINKTRQVWWKIRPHFDFGTIEFRICDVQRSIQKTEMIIALCQALVYQSVLDYQNGILKEDLNLELLNDGLWKATRFGQDAKVCDAATEEVISLRNFIQSMIDYSSEALNYFGNGHIIKFYNSVDGRVSECDEQLKIYEESGFSGLKKYLTDSVDYNYN